MTNKLVRSFGAVMVAAVVSRHLLSSSVAHVNNNEKNRTVRFLYYIQLLPFSVFFFFFVLRLRGSDSRFPTHVQIHTHARARVGK